MLQRDIEVPAVDITSLSVHEVEARARAMRAQVVASWFRKLGARVTEWLESARRRSEEEYLARSQTHAELEARMRELERRGHVPHL